eukprot:TRINITY_DN68192_c0_g1_i2.p1 TRINITY_DN68192_c0_g1~~TRINITY_DN68192_c0_g1_i2.p1  ORF type:complete len:244 (-),score=37.50 TRINITY_DN68192_c0_g1_i2:455-1186(-)
MAEGVDPPCHRNGLHEAPDETMKLGSLLGYVRDLCRSGDPLLTGELIEMLEVEAPLARVEGLAPNAWSKAKDHVERRRNGGRKVAGPNSNTPASTTACASEDDRDAEFSHALRHPRDGLLPCESGERVVSVEMGGDAASKAKEGNREHPPADSRLPDDKKLQRQPRSVVKAAAKGYLEGPIEPSRGNHLGIDAADKAYLTGLLTAQASDSERALAKAFFAVRFQQVRETQEASGSGKASGHGA